MQGSDQGDGAARIQNVGRDLHLDLPARVPKDKEAEVLQQFAGKLPESDQILFERMVDKDTGVEFRMPYVVKKRVMLTGDVLSDARVAIGQFNDSYVSITFDSKGGQEFERITGENVKKRMAVVLDNTIYSAPVIQERISGGRAQITGTFTTQEANDLAIVLRAGALPAPLKIVQDLTVGPSLGQDSIDKGIRATLIAGAMVVIFMIIYYRLSGLIADFALVLNLVCLMGALSAVTATLTLPGIAGIVLTIGMGVDSNVLIFGRIREELRGGKAPRSAIDAGYDKALLTIIDSRDDADAELPCFWDWTDQGICRDAMPEDCHQSLHGIGQDKVIFDLLYHRRKSRR